MNASRLLTNVLLWPIHCAFSVLVKLQRLRPFDFGYSRGGFVTSSDSNVIGMWSVQECGGCGRLIEVRLESGELGYAACFVWIFTRCATNLPSKYC